MAIEAGKYRAKCTGPQDAQWGRSKNGNMQLALVFDLLDLPNQQITWIATFTENTQDRIADSLDYCGMLDSATLDTLTGVDTNEVELVVEMKEAADGSGKRYPQVAWVNKLGGGRIKFQQPVEKSELKGLSREFAAIRKARAAEKGRSNPTPNRAPSRQASGADPRFDADVPEAEPWEQ